MHSHCFFVFFSFMVAMVLAGNVWQITDIHYDAGYVAGGVEHNMCHSNGSKSSNVSAEGDYLCDSPYPLVMSALKYMKIVNPNPDFIIWTGDDVPHLEAPSYSGPDELTLNSTLAAIKNVTTFIQQAFPNIQVFPSLGNHDWFPPYQVTPGPNPIMQQLASFWSQWLDKDAIETFLIGGYYTQLAKPGLRIVSLNTIFYYHSNRMCTNLTDPSGQLAWLSSTLASARAANEKIWLIAHVPPGFHEKFGINNFWTQFTAPYLAALSGYSDVIVTQIYGHDHTDSFRFYFDTPLSTVPSGYMLLAPSVTPWRSPYYPQGPNNPGVRQYSYDDSSFALLDYVQYWSNLSADILANQITWSPLYSFASTFDLSPPLSASSLYSAFLNMLGNDTLFQTYANYMSVNYPAGPCDGTCRLYLLCAMTTYQLSKWTACTGLAPPTPIPPSPPPSPRKMQ